MCMYICICIYILIYKLIYGLIFKYDMVYSCLSIYNIPYYIDTHSVI